MTIFSYLWIATCALGLILSLASARVLGERSRATQAGWIATGGYFIVAAIDAIRTTTAPLHLDYILLAALTIAFAIAGKRDEPQAEPWWLPTHAGPIGAERRARKAVRSDIP